GALATDSAALGADSSGLGADSAGLATDFAALATDSTGLGAKSAGLGAESAVAPVALVEEEKEEEDQAPFPRARPRPVETEQAGMMSAAAATPKDGDVAPPPSRSLSDEGPVVAYGSKEAPLEVDEEVKVGATTGGVGAVTPAAASRPKEVSE
ncbi:unnamed protein product, partial [Laminaria digitata]